MSEKQDAQEDRGIYKAYYNRFYLCLKTGRLNFQAMAERTGFRERRLRETLLYRLGANGVRQLFGYHERTCYLCEAYIPVTKELICLGCLARIDQAILADDSLNAGTLPVSLGPMTTDNLLAALDLGELPDADLDDLDLGDLEEGAIQPYGFERSVSKTSLETGNTARRV